MKHTLSVLVENSPGVLTRVAGLFSRRGFNIHSLAVGVTQNPNVSRMTIVVEGDNSTLEQVEKQLNKLINVIKVSDITGDDFVSRELALVKVSSSPSQRSSILQIVDIFRAKIVDVSKKSMMVEITGDDHKIDAFLDLMKEFGIKEVVRTGKIAMTRGAKALEINFKGEEIDGKDILRWRRRLESPKGETGGGFGLWESRTRASAESQG